jgi:SulP family sulfate permease
VYPLIVGGLALMVFFPKITTVIPTPLVSIVILTVITVAAGIAVPTVGERASCPPRCRCRACRTCRSRWTP